MTASEIETQFALTGVVTMSDDTGNVTVTADTPISDDLHAQILAALNPPSVITPRQLRLYLLSIGQITTVESILTGMPGTDGDAARIEWEYSQEVRRAHPLTAAIGRMLGLDDEALDSAFAIASTL